LLNFETLLFGLSGHFDAIRMQPLDATRVQASHLYPICYQQDPSGFGVTHDLRAGFCKPDWETLEQRLNQFKGVVGCYIAKSLAEIKYKEHHSHGCHFLDSVRGTSQNLQQSVVQTCNLPGDKAGLTARVETLRKLVESDCSEIQHDIDELAGKQRVRFESFNAQEEAVGNFKG
jgi:hypothetical protein